MSDKPSEQGCRHLSNRTVAIIFGLLALGFTITVGCLAGWLFALLVPATILGFVVAILIFQMAYQRVIFPVIALLVLGVVRLFKIVLSFKWKKDDSQQGR